MLAMFGSIGPNVRLYSAPSFTRGLPLTVGNIGLKSTVTARLFPAFQFAGATVLPGVARVLAAAHGTASWAILQFLVEGHEGLGGERPVDMLRGDDDAVARLVRFAGALAD